MHILGLHLRCKNSYLNHFYKGVAPYGAIILNIKKYEHGSRSGAVIMPVNSYGCSQPMYYFNLLACIA
jgi:hypothetical protein